MEFKFEKVAATQVRVTSVNKRRSQTNWLVQEVSAVYDPSVLSDQYTGTATDTNAPIPFVASDNLFLASSGATVGDCTVHSSYSTRSKNLLIDGVAANNTSWGQAMVLGFTKEKNTAYFEINLKEQTKINKVNLYYTWGEISPNAAAYAPDNIAIDVKLPDGTWKRVVEKQDVDKPNDSNVYQLSYTFEPKER